LKQYIPITNKNNQVLVLPIYTRTVVSDCSQNQNPKKERRTIAYPLHAFKIG
jgi:hypothetical protein